MKFVLSRKAVKLAIDSLKKLETLTLAAALQGAFGSSPRLVLLVTLATLVVCRVAALLLCCVVAAPATPRKRLAATQEP